MKTIEQINAEYVKLSKEAENFLIIEKYCGTKIAKELKEMPFFDSGYSMGGHFMFVTPNDEVFGKDNNCEEYPRSYKYSATHGNVKAKFKTKKAMKDFFSKVADIQKNKYIGVISKEEYKALRGYKKDNLITRDELKKESSELNNLVIIEGLKNPKDVEYTIFRGIYETLI